MIQNTPWP